MKTVSGLSSEHLRFDVGAFIPQLRDAPKASNEGDHFATHPSSLIRCRALPWFSLNDFCIRGDDHFNKEQLTKLDKRIENDLTLFVDGPTKRLIEDAKEDLAIWISGQNVTKTANQARQFPINKQIGKTEKPTLKNYQILRRALTEKTVSVITQPRLLADSFP